ncbi:hypothetical protein PHJA_001970700 [Phtheirospermum japonicum]|uniref:Uncharacterized protein n=1 Tax=Phtheirospermum japonicum TaxID=374723 RepID=A0A830CLU4_9LAMI|nr:hypothetical protein PHJA_001970700 [Phtheirospermum japonicum]
MGCCLSTNASSKHPKTSRISNPTPKNSNISKSPPPTNPLLEVETVKEVLSETRTIPKSPSPRAQSNRPIESPFIKNAPLLLPDFARNANVHRNGVVYKKPYAAFGGDDVFEDVVSEICSTLGESESVSVSTNVTEKREERNDEQLRRSSPVKRNNAAYSGEVKRDKAVGRSPGRRPEPSPGRARPGPVSGSGNVRRRDSGESSGRRSRSPVARTDSGPSKMGSGRSPSTRKTGKSPGRVGSGLGERTRRVDEERKWPPTGDESLENPLVSLECFIFL